MTVIRYYRDGRSWKTEQINAPSWFDAESAIRPPASLSSGVRHRLRIVLTLVLLALLSGCSSGPVLPLPQETPYDSEAKERATYLRGFASGYQLGWDGQMLPDGWGLVHTSPPPRLVRAFDDGRGAGHEVGSAARRAWVRAFSHQMP
jgi:hypothetical protein